MQNQNNQLAKSNYQLTFSQDEIKVLVARFKSPNITEIEWNTFMMEAMSRGLNPFLNEIYLVKYKEKCTTMVSVHAMFNVVSQNPKYAGLGEAEFEDKDGKIISCKKSIYMFTENGERVAIATAKLYMSEYNQGNNLWLTKPRTMLEKCVDAHLFRKFPTGGRLGSVYTADEIKDAEYEDVTPKKTTENWREKKPELVEKKPEPVKIEKKPETKTQPPAPSNNLDLDI